MQRNFSGRYLIFGFALLTVWVLAKSGQKLEQPASEWKEISVESPAECSMADGCLVVSNLPGSKVECVGEPAVESSAGADETGSQNHGLELDSLKFEESASTRGESGDVADLLSASETPSAIKPDGNVSSDVLEVNGRKPEPQLVAGVEAYGGENWLKNPYLNQPMELDEEAILDLPPAELDGVQASILDSAANAPVRDSESVRPADFQASGVPEVDSAIAPAAVQLTDAAAQRAVHRIEYGKSLSRRGAAFAAKQEFIGALAVIAQANDDQSGGTAYTSALQMAVTTLREAEDFFVVDPERQIGMNIAHVVETHASKIISQPQAALMTPVQAMQRYLTVAHQQLDFAGGRNMVTSEALFCLGKLHSMMAQKQSQGLDVAKAIVFHRAALVSDERNHRSANELGVLLAQSGQLEDAAKLIQRSLLIQPATRPWENLAKIHQRMGQPQLAELAQNESRLTGQRAADASSLSPIRWMPSADFNEFGTPELHDSTSTARMAQLPDVGDFNDRGAVQPKKSFVDKLNPKSWF